MGIRFIHNETCCCSPSTSSTSSCLQSPTRLQGADDASLHCCPNLAPRPAEAAAQRKVHGHPYPGVGSCGNGSTAAASSPSATRSTPLVHSHLSAATVVNPQLDDLARSPAGACSRPSAVSSRKQRCLQRYKLRDTRFQRSLRPSRSCSSSRTASFPDRGHLQAKTSPSVDGHTT